MQPRTLPRGRAAVLRAVTGCRGRREEQALHCLVCKLGLASDVVLATALLVRYGKHGLLAPAQRLFDEMPRRDAVAFNAMLAALGASGRADDARRLFDRMPEPDRTPASWNTLLTCYCRAGDLASARAVFEASLRAATSSVVSWNAMVDGYCKAGRMDAARELFDRMGSSLRDVVTYNTMMAGYLRRGDPAAAIAMFRRLTQEGDQETPRPTAVTIATVVTACTQVGDFGFGRAVHLSARQLLGTSPDAVLSNALMDMYFKCGSVDRALEVFSAMPPGAPNLFCWNTVIAGLGRNGRGEDAVRAFRDMVEASKKNNEVKPDSVTFVALLSACSHSGLVAEAGRSSARCCRPTGWLPGRSTTAAWWTCCAARGCSARPCGSCGRCPSAPTPRSWGACCSTRAARGTASRRASGRRGGSRSWTAATAPRTGCPTCTRRCRGGITSRGTGAARPWRAARSLDGPATIRMRASSRHRLVCFLQGGHTRAHTRHRTTGAVIGSPRLQ
ncbi:unnamed protein product [Triticum turgidum subsp. durum]|uniref:Pentatricopeptide repeat-containing protein n=1 Tax=Triticum turgidum subsp. durum TaxID=4567 RepID=A0A9R0Z5Z9_TRITD|nr:unnamed protein product [Triticum turgidum subsp. durum]